jgi:hypothetical protein
VSEERRTFPWHRLITGLPLFLIALAIFESSFVPGDDFFEGNVSGIYALYKYQFEIGTAFTNAIVITSTLGLLMTGLLLVFWRNELKKLFDQLLGIVNLFLVGGCLFLIFAINIDFGWPFLKWHVDSFTSDGRVYHVAMHGAGTATCPNDSYCGKVKYVIIKCDEWDFICHRQATVETEFPGSLGATVRFLEVSGRLQLTRQGSSEVLWESSSQQ